VTAGGYSGYEPQSGNPTPAIPWEFKRQDNGWTATWHAGPGAVVLVVHAECLKIVNQGATGMYGLCV
jgi:hypothetical protein